MLAVEARKSTIYLRGGGETLVLQGRCYGVEKGIFLGVRRDWRSDWRGSGREGYSQRLREEIGWWRFALLRKRLG